jgi:tRNA A37 threonylcarbamoyladenosine dehydratase
LKQFNKVKKILGSHFIKISNLKIIIFGIGGVGGYALDCLYRNGVSNITIVDFDIFEESNRNRQIGSDNNIGKLKVKVLKNIYPKIETISEKVTLENIQKFNLTNFDYVIDALDDIPIKVELAKRVDSKKLISSMGSANKLNPLKIEIKSIWKTHTDPLARKFRYELRKSGFSGDFKTIFSSEISYGEQGGSFSAVTGSFGLIICSEIIRENML